MRKTLTLLLALLALATWADDGHTLWLGNDLTPAPTDNRTNARRPAKAPAQTTVTQRGWNKKSKTFQLAVAELQAASRISRVEYVLDPQSQLGEGFAITTTLTGQNDAQWTSYQAVITGSTEAGLLYATYDLLRQLQTTRPHAFTTTSRPAFGLRMLNHWDNLDGTVERGYAGSSIWKWEQINGGQLSDALRARLANYARANASIGLNGTVLNNVNTQPRVLTTEYLEKVKVIADFLRPYGLRVYLSVNFATPMALGETTTADPLDSNVATWWKNKADAIYRLIPDFGGFLVKANSEGQPGPGDYHRTHAQGANMLAAALKPHGGTVIWRSFVYGANHKGEDRVRQAVSEFKPMDGLFADNVILQSKNGPLDFQPREPYAPIFDQVKQTPQMAELQITQEYLGQSKHLVFLAPMWREFFSYVAPQQLKGIAAVANTGDDANYCGHPFSQANWYAFGRLAWDPTLTATQIAREWLQQTFHLADNADNANGTDGSVLQQLTDMMVTSREACVNYMMPLGLHHIFKFDHHMGPEPDGFKAEYPIEWCPVYYHKADSLGIGFDRTSTTGSAATQQYREPYASLYDNLQTCPDEMLLWFHHVPWTHTMHTGRTLWEELNARYAQGVAAVDAYQTLWQTPAVRSAIDSDIWQHVDTLLQFQADDARLWQTTCLDYFKSFIK